MCFGEDAFEEGVGGRCVQFFSWGEGFAAGGFKRGDHFDAFPGFGPVDFVLFPSLGVVCCFESAGDVLDEAGD